MKSYIQDLCGDEDTVVIDYAILQCMLQDAVFEKLVGKPFNTDVMAELKDVVYEIIGPYVPQSPDVFVDLMLKRGVR